MNLKNLLIITSLFFSISIALNSYAKNSQSRMPEGFVAGGEGGKVGLKKVSRKRVRTESARIIDQKVMFFHFLHVEKELHSIVKSSLGTENPDYKLVYKKLFHNEKFGSIVDLSIELNEGNFKNYNWGFCPSKNDGHSDMSVISKKPLKICVSTWSLSSKLYESNLFSEVANLTAHELMHVFGLDHDEISLVERATISQRTFSDSLIGKTHFNVLRTPTTYEFLKKISKFKADIAGNSHIENCKTILNLTNNFFSHSKVLSFEYLFNYAKSNDQILLKKFDRKIYDRIKKQTLSLESYCLDPEVAALKSFRKENQHISVKYPQKGIDGELYDSLSILLKDVKLFWDNIDYFDDPYVLPSEIN